MILPAGLGVAAVPWLMLALKTNRKNPAGQFPKSRHGQRDPLSDFGKTGTLLLPLPRAFVV